MKEEEVPARHVARMRGERNAQGVWGSTPEGKSYTEELGVDGRVILKCIMARKWWAAWTRLI